MPTPRKKSYRVFSITDGYVCCSDAPSQNWCGRVHGDPLEAELCIQKSRLARPPKAKDTVRMRWVFRGQIVEHADGRVEVSAIQRSEFNIRRKHSYLSFTGSLEKEIPGYQGGCFVERRTPSGRLRWIANKPEVYARNIELLEAEIERRGSLGMLSSYTLHVDAQGRRYADLEQLERDNAREARKQGAIREASVVNEVRPVKPTRRGRHVRRVA